MSGLLQAVQDWTPENGHAASVLEQVRMRQDGRDRHGEVHPHHVSRCPFAIYFQVAPWTCRDIYRLVVDGGAHPLGAPTGDSQEQREAAGTIHVDPDVAIPWVPGLLPETYPLPRWQRRIELGIGVQVQPDAVIGRGSQVTSDRRQDPCQVRRATGAIEPRFASVGAPIGQRILVEVEVTAE